MPLVTDDIHFPSLTVRQTLNFAAASRAPRGDRRIDIHGRKQSRSDFNDTLVEVIATMLGLKHTFDTKVGNDVVRGVSGGERKRVTVAEAFASRAKVALFDNSSRGLDSKTALEFVKSLRIGADTMKISIAASIYQAGEALTDLFDKVLVINEGQQVYFGSLSGAVAHFERLGFVRVPRQTTADFLVACASGEAGHPRGSDGEEKLPTTPASQRAAWLASPEASELHTSVVSHMKKYTETLSTTMPQSAAREKAKLTRPGSSFTISNQMQLGLAIRRRFQVVMGDAPTVLVTAFASVFHL